MIFVFKQILFLLLLVVLWTYLILFILLESKWLLDVLIVILLSRSGWRHQNWSWWLKCLQHREVLKWLWAKQIHIVVRWCRYRSYPNVTEVVISHIKCFWSSQIELGLGLDLVQCVLFCLFCWNIVEVLWTKVSGGTKYILIVLLIILIINILYVLKLVQIWYGSIVVVKKFAGKVTGSLVILFQETCFMSQFELFVWDFHSPGTITKSEILLDLLVQ